MRGGLKQFLQWFFGIFFIFGTVALATVSLLAGALMGLAAVVILPPTAARLQNRIRVSVPTEARVFAAIGLFMAAAYVHEGVAEKKRQEKQSREALALEEKRANERAARIEQFKKTGDALVAEASALIAAENWQGALDKIGPYADIGDAKLTELLARAREGQGKANADKRTNQLLASLKANQKIDVGQSAAIYTELAKLNPANKGFSERASYFGKLHKAEQDRHALAAERARQAQQVAAERVKQIEAQFSQWDGSHRKLESIIKAGMHNPKTYEHVQSGYRDMGTYVLVTTTFRGSNAFGGIVTNSSTAKVDLHGNILEVTR